MKELSEAQRERYSRQLILSCVGGAGQAKLLESRVLLIGVGGLGSPAAYYLAAAGVGTLGLMDGDRVDLSNLQRQILHTTRDVGQWKVDSAREKLEALNPDVRILTYRERFEAHNAEAILKNYDFVIDGTDHFPSKFLIADACHLTGKPYSHGGILRYQGQTLTVIPGKTACYRCVFRDLPPEEGMQTCSHAGILGVVAGIIGNLQAAEALKYLLKLGDGLTDRLWTLDVFKMTSRIIPVSRQEACPLCGKNPVISGI